ncbi:hypothetical protein ACX0G9_28505 [Flavitalea flava]
MKTSLTGKAFFDEVFFPLFFNQDKHLMHVSNSPFFQKPSQKAIETGISIPQLQLQKLHADIGSEAPNMAIFVGYAAKDLEGTTSGQLTSIDFNITPDEMYASWIGEALAIGVSGGLVMLIDNKDVLWSLFGGWIHYRNFLSQTPNVKDKQIETWNGQWLCHIFSRNYDRNNPFLNFKIETVEVQGNIAIPTQAWSKVVFSLVKGIRQPYITAYIYSLSQTNTTLGFINIYLGEVNKMYELRDKLFIQEKETVLNDKEIEELSVFFNFKTACKQGTIGLKSIEPDKLRDYMPKGTVIYAKGNEYKLNSEQSYFNFQLYKLWITAMLNKTELLDLAGQTAKALVTLENDRKLDSRGKTGGLTQDSKEIRESRTVRDFIDLLTKLLEQSPANTELFKSIVEEVVKMPVDNFPLFVTLIRFEYVYQKQN